MAHRANDKLPDVPQADAYSDITKHELDQAEASGQPDLDEASPLGQTQPGQANRRTGGAGSRIDPQRRVSQEQPGTGTTNPVPHAPEATAASVDPSRVNTPTGPNTAPDYIYTTPGLPSNIRVAEAPEGGMQEPGPDRQGASNAPAGGSSVPLSPADPARETDEGQPYLDDTNPFGRSLPNQQNRPLGGTGTWTDPQKRVSHEEPGTDAANPLPQALKSRPRRDPEA